MVAFDGSARSRRALQAGISLAGALGSKLYTITVTEGVPAYVEAGAFVPVSPDFVGELALEREARQQNLVDLAQRMAYDAGVEIHTDVVSGTTVESIIEAVNQRGCDLLILGLNRHPGLISKLTSHTAYDLAECASCSVLGVR